MDAALYHEENLKMADNKGLFGKLFGKKDAKDKVEETVEEVKEVAKEVAKEVKSQADIAAENAKRVADAAAKQAQAEAKKAEYAARKVADDAAAAAEAVRKEMEGLIAKHTVAEGETLGHIAKKYYDNANLYPIIYEANKDVIGANADLVKVGQILRIPVKPEN